MGMVLFACEDSPAKQEEPSGKLNGPAIKGLASPFRMNAQQQSIPLTDYFYQNTQLDSVAASDGYEVKLKNDSLVISTLANAPAMGLIQCWQGDFRYDLLCFKSKKQQVELQYELEAKTVAIAGEMTNWAPQALEYDSTTQQWKKSLLLFPGQYQYQLVIDKKWQLDPKNKQTADNGIGGTNSLLEVGEIPQNSPSPIEIELLGNQQFKINNADNFKQAPVVLWQNIQIVPANEEAGIYEIPAEATKLDRSHLRIWAVNAQQQVSDFLFPLKNGKIITDPKELSVDDPHSQVLYFMLVDRFCNGDTLNDDPLQDPEIHPKANYYGGDIAGIIQKLKDGYFEELGINTIWLSPVTQNPLHGEIEFPEPRRKYSGYHGYWPISATQIDHRFGSSQELKELVELAHSKNMHVILDYVSNHVHQENPIYKKHPDWATDLVLENGEKNIRIWDEQRLTTWFDEFLPTLDYSKPEVIDLMTDSAIFMLKHYNLDGFRHDATKHIPEAFWRTLTSKIKTQIEDPVFQIGETFGSRELIGSYVSTGQLDGQFDFNLYFDLRTALASEQGSLQKLHQSLLASFEHYGMHSLMGNITGNHDIPRFISYAGKDLKFEDDAKKVGWDRDILVKDTVGYQKLELLAAFLLTTPGVPVIYYGDEIGMPGGGDPDNRDPMRFDQLSKQEKGVKSTITKLIQLRKNRMSLLYGDFQSIDVSPSHYIYSRSYLDETTVVFLNNSPKIADLTYKGTTYQLEPYSYKILTIKNNEIQ